MCNKSKIRISLKYCKSILKVKLFEIINEIEVTSSEKGLHTRVTVMSDINALLKLSSTIIANVLLLSILHILL